MKLPNAMTTFIYSQRTFSISKLLIMQIIINARIVRSNITVFPFGRVLVQFIVLMWNPSSQVDLKTESKLNKRFGNSQSIHKCDKYTASKFISLCGFRFALTLMFGKSIIPNITGLRIYNAESQPAHTNTTELQLQNVFCFVLFFAFFSLIMHATGHSAIRNIIRC